MKTHAFGCIPHSKKKTPLAARVNARCFEYCRRFHERLHMPTRQFARIVRDWVTSIGLEASACGRHPMRETKITQIHKKTGIPRGVQLLLGHTKMDSAVRYLGAELEDALAMAEAIEI